VDTRIELVRSGAIDAAILAVAGVARLERRAEVDRILPSTTFLPAPAQGALAVVGRAGDTTIASAVHPMDHVATHLCVSAERTFAAALGGDCRLPLGALATQRRRTVALTGEVLTADGRMSLRLHRRGSATDAERLGASLGKEMLDRGALDLMAPTRR
jgi:hydroxymethylbilane synthase